MNENEEGEGKEKNRYVFLFSNSVIINNVSSFCLYIHQMFTEYEWTIPTIVRDRKYRDTNKVLTLRVS